MKRFADLTEQEVLALAITNEEEDSRIYRGFAEGLREQFPASAKVFDEMAEEEVRHRTMLFDLYRQKFGDYLPLIRRQDVKGFIPHKPLWLMRPLVLDEVRKFAENMEYEAAAILSQGGRQCARRFGPSSCCCELAEAEAGHESLAHKLDEQILTQAPRASEDATSSGACSCCNTCSRACRADGRLGLDAGAAVRRRFRHPQHLGNISGRHGGLGRRRHLDGLRRGACRTTDRSPGAARHGCAARSAA